MKTAVCSTIYPAMMPYLSPFLQSVVSQADADFDFWLGLDGIDAAELESFREKYPVSCISSANETIAGFRSRFLAQICDSYDAVILVDSDDILLPDRVRAAKQALQTYDTYACALRLIDQAGIDLDHCFNYHGPGNWDVELSRMNMFGFSNSAFRSDVLSRCLRIPDNVVLVDWLVISLAVASGAELCFDDTARMLYRQHSSNTAVTLPPFCPEQIVRATTLVEDHYKTLAALLSQREPDNSSFSDQIVLRQRDIGRFRVFIEDANGLADYVGRINSLQNSFCWWEMIAHPALESLWR